MNYAYYIRLRRAFDAAAQNYAFRGSYEPEAWGTCVAEYEAAKAKLDAYVRRFS